jgi:hypothetical protein
MRKGRRCGHLLPAQDASISRGWEFLLLNRSIPSTVRLQVEVSGPHSTLLSFWEYDLHSISAIRRQNGEQLIAPLAPLVDRVNLLFPNLPPGVVPQTLPVVIQQKDRNELFFSMNKAGFGVVSLYHTLIDSIDAHTCFLNHPRSRPGL